MAGERLVYRICLVVTSNFEGLPDPDKIGNGVVEYLNAMCGMGRVEVLSAQYEGFREEVATRPTIPAPPSEKPKEPGS